MCGGGEQTAARGAGVDVRLDFGELLRAQAPLDQPGEEILIQAGAPLRLAV
jgi:hypothetical protein